jgi:hypothetical protein
MTMRMLGSRVNSIVVVKFKGRFTYTRMGAGLLVHRMRVRHEVAVQRISRIWTFKWR